MKRAAESFAALFILLFFKLTVAACPWCRAQVKDGVYNEDFFRNFFMLLLPLLLLAAIGFGLYHADKITELFRRKIK